MAPRRLPWRYLVVALVAAVIGGLVGFGIARVTAAQRWSDLAFTAEKCKTSRKTSDMSSGTTSIGDVY
jgi:membrane protein YqaA with SNARE-associated domain